MNATHQFIFTYATGSHEGEVHATCMQQFSELVCS